LSVESHKKPLPYEEEEEKRHQSHTAQQQKETVKRQGVIVLEFM
jgi:hypothetical protein